VIQWDINGVYPLENHGKTMIYSDLMGFYSDSMGYYWGLPSGYLT
jgi:hypothetical protein